MGSPAAPWGWREGGLAALNWGLVGLRELGGGARWEPPTLCSCALPEGGHSHVPRGHLLLGGCGAEPPITPPGPPCAPWRPPPPLTPPHTL